jgi:hypothetical protein
MRRWASNLFCALSLFVLLVSVAIWVRSYFAGEAFSLNLDWNSKMGLTFVKRAVGCRVEWQRGAIGFEAGSEEAHSNRPPVRSNGFPIPSFYHQEFLPARPLRVMTTPGDKLRFDRGGFQFRYGVDAVPPVTINDTEIIVPLWLFLVFALPPLLWWRKRRSGCGRGFPVTATASSIDGGRTTEGTENTESAEKKSS